MRAVGVLARAGWRKRSRAAVFFLPDPSPPPQPLTRGGLDLDVSFGVRRLCPLHGERSGALHPRLLHSLSGLHVPAALNPAITAAPATAAAFEHPTSTPRTGLFGIASLRQPADFSHIAAATQQTSELASAHTCTRLPANTLSWSSTTREATCGHRTATPRPHCRHNTTPAPNSSHLTLRLSATLIRAVVSSSSSASYPHRHLSTHCNGWMTSVQVLLPTPDGQFAQYARSLSFALHTALIVVRYPTRCAALSMWRSSSGMSDRSCTTR